MSGDGRLGLSSASEKKAEVVWWWWGPYLVPQGAAHDGRVAVVADDAEVEDGDGAEGDVQGDVEAAEEGAQRPAITQLQHGARRHHWEWGLLGLLGVTRGIGRY